MSRAVTASVCGAEAMELAAPPISAQPELKRFLVIAAQLALLLAVIRVFRVEQSTSTDLSFFRLSCLTFGGFALHYWLPFRLKERFWISISLLAMLLMLPIKVALSLLAAGAVFYLLLSSRLSYWWRVGLLTCGCVLAMAMRRQVYNGSAFWPVLGSVFMFRMIVYVHDIRRMKTAPSFQEYLAYFFVAPNFYFQLFPVIDYTTLRLSYYRRNIHVVAQQGIEWMFRGTIQLLAYRIVYYLKDLHPRDNVTSFASLVWFMLLTYLLYLRVSGQFHIIVGMLHLFGYDLPETNRKYFLARSMTDFWRRINIYWKDFMVKIVYFPVYFRLRRRNEMQAKLAATAAVFVVTWALHAYQSFWLRGAFGISVPDTLFWMTLSVIVTVNVWLEGSATRRRPERYGGLKRTVSVAGTFTLMMTLWSLWDSPSLGSWLALLRRGLGPQ